jgi:hypothetical protein
MWVVTTFLVAKWAYNMLPPNVRGEWELEKSNGKNKIAYKHGNGYSDAKTKAESPVDMNGQ